MFNKLMYIFEKRYNRSMEKYDISMEQLNNMVSKGAVLLDIRSPQEYEEGHLEGSILIPEYELMAKVGKIITDKEKTIIVYCNTGTRSKKAQKILNRLGYEKVYNLYQGLDNY